jgi:hypothetical protein
MADYPDLYTDGFAVSISPFGVTLTFQLSQPSLEPGPHVDAGEIVARVRMSPALARALAQGVADAVAQQSNVQQQAEGNVTH